MFLVESAALVAGVVRLSGAEGRHAATVVRLAVGEPVVLVDGSGRRGVGAVAAVVGKDVVDIAVSSVAAEPSAAPRLVVVQALPKGDRGEVAVETMTEVGVDEVVPWAATRCVTRWREGRGDKALAKWRTTAAAAAKQSRRARWPVVADLASTAAVAERIAAASAAVVLHEEATVPLAGWSWSPVLSGAGLGEVVVVVGPEGGLSPEELEAFVRAGATTYHLGPTVLRTSTAGTVALAVLLARTPRWH